MKASPHYITVSAFKAQCLGLLEEVAEKHTMIIVTKFGKPLAKISAIENTKPPLLGSWAGQVEVEGDIVHFDSSDDWEME